MAHISNPSNLEAEREEHSKFQASLGPKRDPASKLDQVSLKLSFSFLSLGKLPTPHLHSVDCNSFLENLDTMTPLPGVTSKFSEQLFLLRCV